MSQSDSDEALAAEERSQETKSFVRRVRSVMEPPILVAPVGIENDPKRSIRRTWKRRHSWAISSRRAWMIEWTWRLPYAVAAAKNRSASCMGSSPKMSLGKSGSHS